MNVKLVPRPNWDPTSDHKKGPWARIVGPMTGHHRSTFDFYAFDPRRQAFRLLFSLCLSASVCCLFLFLFVFFLICCCYHLSLVFALPTLCKRTHQSKPASFSLLSTLNLIERLYPSNFRSWSGMHVIWNQTQFNSWKKNVKIKPTESITNMW